MKAVLISIQPIWCEKIAARWKTLELRKTKPNIPLPFKCYIYQTKFKWVFNLLRSLELDDIADALTIGFGKVIGEFQATGNIPFFVEEQRRRNTLALDISVFVPKV